MSQILVINSGSSSMKYQLVQTETAEVLASGLFERIGEPNAHTLHRVSDRSFRTTEPIADHHAAFARILAAFASHGPALDGLDAVGHRVVQGGAKFWQPTRITEQVEAGIEELSTLAPLHNPANLIGIRAAREAFPSVPHVAVFDTAFHHSMPEAAYTYALDREVAQRHGIRRYGFHGTSHQFVSRQAAQALGTPIEQCNLIVLHLGNGASACAVKAGRSVDTSMGMTPLEGLVMGTRSGDLDPAVPLMLQRIAGMSVDEVDALLNRQSGLKGLSGHGDMRDVLQAAASGDHAAQLAVDVTVHRARGYLGNYAVQLGRIDAVVFTAGVGEHAAEIRARICADLDLLGIRIDAERNAAAHVGVQDISAADSVVRVLVVPTNEELEIARQTAELVG